jgi:hypothetical protein
MHTQAKDMSRSPHLGAPTFPGELERSSTNHAPNMAPAGNTFRRSLDAVESWVEGHHYRGYDPGDGLTSYLRPLTCGNLFAERILQQLVWKSPINLRRLLGVVPLDSTKGQGFMAWGYILRYRTTGEALYREKAFRCLKWLDANREPDQAGHCWGNHFDFTTRSGRLLAHTPTIVWSGLIGQAYLEAYEQTHITHFLDIAESVCTWILSLPKEVTPTGACLSYTAVRQNSVHNSNLLGAAMLARTWKHRPKDTYLHAAREAVAYSCVRQRSDGSWWYGEDEKYHWIDSFHTAYNLDSLKRYICSTNDDTFRECLRKGYRFYKSTFFDASGRTRYYHNQTFPLDIQCAAQAIDTLCFFSSDDNESLPLACKVAEWTIKNMQGPRGNFYYRKYHILTAKTPYFHWGQATMVKALAHLLLCLA